MLHTRNAFLTSLEALEHLDVRSFWYRLAGTPTVPSKTIRNDLTRISTAINSCEVLQTLTYGAKKDGLGGWQPTRLSNRVQCAAVELIGAAQTGLSTTVLIAGGFAQTFHSGVPVCDLLGQAFEEKGRARDIRVRPVCESTFRDRTDRLAEETLQELIFSRDYRSAHGIESVPVVVSIAAHQNRAHIVARKNGVPAVFLSAESILLFAERWDILPTPESVVEEFRAQLKMLAVMRWTDPKGRMLSHLMKNRRFSAWKERLMWSDDYGIEGPEG